VDRPVVSAGGLPLTEEEIEVVAEELAKIGGTSWYPGREEGSLVRVLSDRYRDRARIAITALERYRAGGSSQAIEVASEPPSPVRDTFPAEIHFEVGATVIYRPPGDRRAYACRIEDIADGQIYLVPHIKNCTGWVSVASLMQNLDETSPGE
jgi:hypothetical protein